MKSLQLVCLISAIAALTSCGFGKSGDKEIDFLSPEQRLRSELDRTWAMCKKDESGSTKYVMEIRGSEIRLDAHVYRDFNCSSENYESYRVGNFGYTDFKASDKHNGQAYIHLTRYYPNQRPFENGFTAFENRIMESSQAAFSLDAIYLELKVTLSGIKTITVDDLKRVQEGAKRHDEASAQNVSQNVVMKFHRSEGYIHPMYGKIKTGSLGVQDIRFFESQDKLIQWLTEDGVSAIDSRCIADHFKKPLRPYVQSFGSIADALFEARRSHLDLVAEGYAIRDVSILALEDENKNPFLGFLFYYRVGDNPKTETDSGFVCPVKNRVRGFNLN